MLTDRRLGVALCAAVILSSCASVGRSAQRLAAPSSTGPAAGTQRDETIAPAPALETQDVQLADALRRASVLPTAEHFAAVAYRYYELGVGDTALRYFSSSLALDRRYVPALDGAARAWRDGGQAAMALSSAHRATYFGPRSPEAWNTLGTILQAMDLPAEAAAAYRRAVELDASAVYARSNLCYLAFLQGNQTAAMAECSAAAAGASTFVPAVNNLALTYAASGDSGLAFATFAAAATPSIAHYNMGIVLLAQHRYEDAVSAFEAAYHADPDFDEAYTRARDARRLTTQRR